ncbi:hypothetical protein NDU88_000888 [Pleurodeles waltl]|uniref:Uncharacterized protein n=1 Tax=Pleurodeles waltl TaxID=8319 RepID=A0AAV7URA5_PLEWA|nr:hypothetical protein NDU88_000888 [Pleurodeles waltl]
MIKNHLIYWQTKPIDEVLQYAKYCTDEIELKHKKLKEKAMVMQIKAAQTGMQGTFSTTATTAAAGKHGISAPDERCAGQSHRSCVDLVGDAGKFQSHGRRCIDLSSQEVGLRHSGSAMHRSSGPCVKVTVATLALSRSLLREPGSVVPV